MPLVPRPVATGPIFHPLPLFPHPMMAYIGEPLFRDNFRYQNGTPPAMVWSVTSGTANVQDGIIEMFNAATYSTVYSVATFTYALITFYMRAADTSINTVFGFLRTDPDTQYILFIRNNTLECRDAVGSSSTAYVFDTNWHVYSLLWRVGIVSLFIDGVLAITHNTNVPAVALPIVLQSAINAHAYVKNIEVFR